MKIYHLIDAKTFQKCVFEISYIVSVIKHTYHAPAAFPTHFSFHKFYPQFGAFTRQPNLELGTSRTIFVSLCISRLVCSIAFSLPLFNFVMCIFCVVNYLYWVKLSSRLLLLGNPYNREVRIPALHSTHVNRILIVIFLIFFSLCLFPFQFKIEWMNVGNYGLSAQSTPERVEMKRVSMRFYYFLLLFTQQRFFGHFIYFWRNFAI